MPPPDLSHSTAPVPRTLARNDQANDPERPLELDIDVLSQKLVGGDTAGIIAENGRLDIAVHKVGHIVLGPAEAFTPEQ
ncbi:MAG: hypothetical protein ACREC0_14955 [Methylocella sp.]